MNSALSTIWFQAPCVEDLARIGIAMGDRLEDRLDGRAHAFRRDGQQRAPAGEQRQPAQIGDALADIGGAVEIDEARRERRIVASVGGEEEGDARRLIDCEPGGIEARPDLAPPRSRSPGARTRSLFPSLRGASPTARTSSRSPPRRRAPTASLRTTQRARPRAPAGPSRRGARSFARRRCRGGRHPAQVPGTIALREPRRGIAADANEPPQRATPAPPAGRRRGRSPAISAADRRRHRVRARAPAQHLDREPVGGGEREPERRDPPMSRGPASAATRAAAPGSRAARAARRG